MDPSDTQLGAWAGLALALEAPAWASIVVCGGTPAGWRAFARQLHPDGFTTIDCRGLDQHRPRAWLRTPTAATLLVDADTLDAARQAQLFAVLDPSDASRPRVIAASSRPLFEQVRAGRFREDLFYRLNFISVTLDH